MALAEYPSGLPLPLLLSGYTQHVSPLMRTQMASGRARQRRRFTSVPSMQRVTWRMNQVQAQLFEAWFRHTLTDGADWFSCRLHTPLGAKEYECRFTDIYDGPKRLGFTAYEFSAELELRERQTLDKAWVAFPSYILGQSIIDKAINREWPES